MEPGNDSTSFSKDVVFDILSNQRRRHVLQYLRDHETSTTSDLAEHVAALENDTDVQSLTSSERKRVYVGLYQCHLPKLADAGFIEYNQARGTVELLEATSRAFPYLDLDHGGRKSCWQRLLEPIGAISGFPAR